MRFGPPERPPDWKLEERARPAVARELEGLSPGQHPRLVPGHDVPPIPVKGEESRALLVGEGPAVKGLGPAELLAEKTAGASLRTKILAPDSIIREIGVEADLPALDAGYQAPPSPKASEAEFTPLPPIQAQTLSGTKASSSKATAGTILLFSAVGLKPGQRVGPPSLAKSTLRGRPLPTLGHFLRPHCLPFSAGA